LLVNGDPLRDLGMMVNEDNLVVIMKDGNLYKDTSKAAVAREKAA